MKSIITACLAVVCAFPAIAEDALKKSTAVNFDQVLTDPKGKPFFPCPKDAENCWKDMTLGYVVYLALNSAGQKDPRAPQGQADPQEARRAALGWRIYSTGGDIELTDAERVMIREWLFKGLSMPSLAYAACRQIGDPDQCVTK